MLYEIMSRPRKNKSAKTWTFPMGKEYRATYIPSGNRIIVECSDEVKLETNGNPVQVTLNDAGYYEASVTPGKPYDLVVENVSCSSLAVVDIEVDEYHAQYYFQYRNISGSLIEVTLYSASDTKVYLNGEKLDSGIPAGGEIGVSMRPGDAIRTVGQTATGTQDRPLIKTAPGSAVGIVVDAFDGSVASMRYAFYGCASLTHIPSNPNIVASDFRGAFQDCSALSIIPDSFKWLENATDITEMFSGCANIRFGGVEGHTYMSKVTSCGHAFDGCSDWTGPSEDMYRFLATKAVPVTSYEGCFVGCESSYGYAYIPVSWGGQGLEREAFLFKNVGVESVPVKLFSDGETSVYIDDMPYGTFNEECENGFEIELELEPGSKCEVIGLHRNNSLFKKEDYDYDYELDPEMYRSSPANIMEAKADVGCIEIVKFDSAWRTMHSAFLGCTALKKVPDRWRAVGASDVQIYSIRSVFQGCTNLENIPMSFDGIVACHDSMSMAFRDCSSIKHAPTDWYNIRRVPDRTYLAYDRTLDAMFSGCINLEDGVLDPEKAVMTGGLDKFPFQLVDVESPVSEWYVVGEVSGPFSLWNYHEDSELQDIPHGYIAVKYTYDWQFVPDGTYIIGQPGETVYADTMLHVIGDDYYTERFYGIRAFMQDCVKWKGNVHLLISIFETMSSNGPWGHLKYNLGMVCNTGGNTEDYDERSRRVVVDNIPLWWTYDGGIYHDDELFGIYNEDDEDWQD